MIRVLNIYRYFWVIQNQHVLFLYHKHIRARYVRLKKHWIVNDMGRWAGDAVFMAEGYMKYVHWGREFFFFGELAWKPYNYNEANILMNKLDIYIYMYGKLK